jgi:hypothetical protein
MLSRAYVPQELAMPRRKLTLSVEEEAIRKARWFSKKHRTSISSPVSGFLSSLSDNESPDTPIVSRLRGVLSPEVRIEDHHDHLIGEYDRWNHSYIDRTSY